MKAEWEVERSRTVTLRHHRIPVLSEEGELRIRQSSWPKTTLEIPLEAKLKNVKELRRLYMKRLTEAELELGIPPNKLLPYVVVADIANNQRIFPVCRDIDTHAEAFAAIARDAPWRDVAKPEALGEYAPFSGSLLVEDHLEGWLTTFPRKLLSPAEDRITIPIQGYPFGVPYCAQADIYFRGTKHESADENYNISRPLSTDMLKFFARNPHYAMVVLDDTDQILPIIRGEKIFEYFNRIWINKN